MANESQEIMKESHKMSLVFNKNLVSGHRFFFSLSFPFSSCLFCNIICFSGEMRAPWKNCCPPNGPATNTDSCPGWPCPSDPSISNPISRRSISSLIKSTLTNSGICLSVSPDPATSSCSGTVPSGLSTSDICTWPTGMWSWTLGDSSWRSGIPVWSRVRAVESLWPRDGSPRASWWACTPGACTSPVSLSCCSHWATPTFYGTNIIN